MFDRSGGNVEKTFMQEPVHVQIQTTTACNGRCIICPHQETWGRRPAAAMEQTIFDRIMRELQGVRLGKLIMYLENEPLLDLLLLERLEEAKRRLRFQVLEVATNAAALTPDMAGRLAACLAEVKNEIRVSFHGADARTHQGCMGLNYELCLQNVVHLLKLSQDAPLQVYLRGAGQPAKGVPAHPFTFTREQYHAHWGCVFEEHGITKLPRVDYFHYHDRARNIRRGPLRARDQAAVRSLQDFRCIRTERWLHFLHSGELTLCCMDYNREAVFGDIRKEPLADILAGPALARLRAQARGEIDSPEDFICKRCVSPGG